MQIFLSKAADSGLGLGTRTPPPYLASGHTQFRGPRIWLGRSKENSIAACHTNVQWCMHIQHTLLA